MLDQNMRVLVFHACNVIIKQQQNKTYANILNQYMKGSSSLAINVITKQQQNKIYQSITIHNIRVKGRLNCDVNRDFFLKLIYRNL